jgi:transposase InsO family protein
MNREYIKKRRDLLKQSYITSKNNYVVCIDITKLDKEHYLFCALDLAGRNIIGHCFKDCFFVTEDILECLQTIINDRDFLPNIIILHSDRESIFRNQKYENFFDSKQIAISRAAATGHNNQVIERTFRTLKALIRKKKGFFG